MTQDERKVIEMFVALYDAARSYSNSGVAMPHQTLDTIAEMRSMAVGLIVHDEMKKTRREG